MWPTEGKLQSIAILHTALVLELCQKHLHIIWLRSLKIDWKSLVGWLFIIRGGILRNRGSPGHFRVPRQQLQIAVPTNQPGSSEPIRAYQKKCSIKNKSTEKIDCLWYFDLGWSIRQSDLTHTRWQPNLCDRNPQRIHKNEVKIVHLIVQLRMPDYSWNHSYFEERGINYGSWALQGLQKKGNHKQHPTELCPLWGQLALKKKLSLSDWMVPPSLEKQSKLSQCASQVGGVSKRNQQILISAIMLP